MHLSTGLSSADVPALRAQAGGPNEFSVKASEPALARLVAQLSEPLIVLLLGSALVSLLLGEVDDAASIAVAVAIVVAVGWVQEQRSEKSLEALHKLVPHWCHLVRDGGVRSGEPNAAAPSTGLGTTTTVATAGRKVLANELVPGDVVTFSVGDRVPADVRLFAAVQLEVDESTLTGEIKPRRKRADALCAPQIPLDEARRLLAGGEPPLHGWGGKENGTAAAESGEEDLPGQSAISDRDNIVFMGTLVKSGE